MHIQTSAALILGGAIVIAALLFVFGPMLWTDHVILDFRVPIPAGCSVHPPAATPGYTVVHCPIWVNYTS